MFAEEFSDEMSKQFQEAMRSVMEDDPEMLAEINRLAEAAGNAGRWQPGPWTCCSKLMTSLVKVWIKISNVYI